MTKEQLDALISFIKEQADYSAACTEYEYEGGAPQVAVKEAEKALQKAFEERGAKRKNRLTADRRVGGSRTPSSDPYNTPCIHRYLQCGHVKVVLVGSTSLRCEKCGHVKAVYDFEDEELP